MGNQGFVRILMWWMSCSQKITELFFDKFSIYWGKEKIPITLSSLWEIMGPMLRYVGVIKFGNPSGPDLWTFWFLVTLCGMPKGKQ